MIKNKLYDEIVEIIKFIENKYPTKMVDTTKYRHFADTVTQIITDTNTAIKVRSTRSVKGKDTPTTPAKS